VGKGEKETDPKAAKKDRGHWIVAIATVAATGLGVLLGVKMEDRRRDGLYVPVNVRLDLDAPLEVGGGEGETVWVRGRLVVENPGEKAAHVLPSIYVAKGRRFEMAEPRSERLFLSRLRRAFNSPGDSVELARDVLEEVPETVAGGTILAGWSLAPSQEAFHDIAFAIPADRYDLVEVTVQMPISATPDGVDVVWSVADDGGFQPIFQRSGGVAASTENTEADAKWFDEIKLDVVSTTARIALRSPRNGRPR
jgi:hypothetical protein